jgi:PAS domain S-box-containing protein
VQSSIPQPADDTDPHHDGISDRLAAALAFLHAPAPCGNTHQRTEPVPAGRDTAYVEIDPVVPGLTLTADDAIVFGRRWHTELVSITYLPIHRRFADQIFGRWTAAFLCALGARVENLEQLFGPDAPDLDTPAQVGRNLSYRQRLSADALATCVKVLSDLATEYTPFARRALKARVVGEFAGGFAGGLQDRVRDEQTVITNAMVRTQALRTATNSLSPRHFRAAVLDTVTAVLALDRRGRIVEANATVQALLGRDLDELRLHTLADLAVTAADADTVRHAVTTALDSPHSYSHTRADFRVRVDKGRPPRWVTATIGHAVDGGAQRGASVLLEDITLLRGLEQSTAIESATGLLTEAAFTDEATRILADNTFTVGATGSTTVAVLTIRLGNWAELDRVLLPDTRTQLLQQVRTRIQSAPGTDPATMLIGRSGDDVVVLLHDLTNWSVVTRMVKVLADWLSDPVRVAPHHIRLQPHIGVAQAHPDLSLAELLRQTRLALHDSDHAAEQWIVADSARSDTDLRALGLLSDLARALDHHALRVDYRPILTLADGTLAGVRPVPYWLDDDGHRHNVSDVVDLAGNTGLLTSVLPRTLDLVCRDAAIWSQAEHAPAILLDLPGRTVHDEGLLNTLETTARGAGLRPGQLHLAIPARSLTGTPRALTHLGELNRAGIALSLTGYWDDHLPLRTLTTLPWRTISMSAATITVLTDAPRSSAGTLMTAALRSIHAFGARSLADGQLPIDPHADRFDLVCRPETLTIDDIRRTFRVAPPTATSADSEETIAAPTAPLT